MQMLNTGTSKHHYTNLDSTIRVFRKFILIFHGIGDYGQYPRIAKLKRQVAIGFYVIRLTVSAFIILPYRPTLFSSHLSVTTHGTTLFFKAVSKW